jgi:hypothetical protein
MRHHLLEHKEADCMTLKCKNCGASMRLNPASELGKLGAGIKRKQSPELRAARIKLLERARKIRWAKL